MTVATGSDSFLSASLSEPKLFNLVLSQSLAIFVPLSVMVGVSHHIKAQFPLDFPFTMLFVVVASNVPRLIPHIRA